MPIDGVNAREILFGECTGGVTASLHAVLQAGDRRLLEIERRCWLSRRLQRRTACRENNADATVEETEPNGGHASG